jgi:hypothetical protein
MVKLASAHEGKIEFAVGEIEKLVSDPSRRPGKRHVNRMDEEAVGRSVRRASAGTSRGVGDKSQGNSFVIW